ncbi:hypothetical protein ONZ45_g8602 [Pleurotus djamor]|nr:hypothetical protein ONZ45_g8602 [Pleurotus djamor]
MIALYSSAHIDVAGAQAAFLHARTLYGAILATMANVVVWDWNVGNGAISALLYAYAGGNGSRMEYRFDIDSANYEVVHINGMDVRNVLDVGGLRFNCGLDGGESTSPSIVDELNMELIENKKY